MRLYLSSYKLGNFPQELVRLVGEGSKRVAVILNAADFTSVAERAEGLQRQIDLLAGLGFLGEEIDLRKYFNKEQELKEIMSKFGAVWVRGGNVFLLRRAFKQSGFDNIIKELLAEDKIVYAGYSAGPCVLAPSLHGLEIVDPPELLAEGYDKEIIWDGLNILPYSFSPHYKSDHPESGDIDKEIAYMEEHNIPFKAVRDGEVIVINGDRETFFSI